MEKVLYFDCSSGISGDMILGALVDLGLNIRLLERELSKLDIGRLRLSTVKIIRGHLSGTKININTEKRFRLSSPRDIQILIDKSQLANSIKKLSKKIFLDLARAESKIHNVKLDLVHFHQLAEVDTIIDIVGTCIGLKALGVRKSFSSAVSVGCGTITFEDMRFPNPAPATLELLKGRQIQILRIKKEIVTPTGAAILKNITSHPKKMPRIKVERIGYGAGTYRIKEIPNFLRIIYGTTNIR